MTIVSESILIESQTARNKHLNEISSQKAAEVLNKVKALFFALWKGTGATTTEEIARYYEVESSVVRHASKKHREEFLKDGWLEVKGKDNLNALRRLGCEAFSLPDATTRVAIWTPRSALRLAMLLRDSEVAKTVRTSLLDIVEKVVPAQTQEIERLKLELEVARTQERLLTTTSALATMYGSGMVALILGKPEAVITKTERVETVVTVDNRGKAIAQFDGVGITYLAKRYGFGSNTRACRYWLSSIGVSDEQWLTEPTLIKSQKLPRDILPWLDRQYAARTGVRQQLLGE